ncbi:MAG: hypothetical protein CMB68_05095 [Euryarchaeota archaeon]|nr:hypothetical protein [Euryarchaeota archaeon]
MSSFSAKDCRRLTAGLVVITFLVIALGGLIRIYDAGESCPDWPTCFGTWGFDVSEADQESWYEDNPDEVDSRGAGHRYTTFQIFTEWAHRVLAGAGLGPLVLAGWFLFRQVEKFGSEVRLASTVSVALIIWQGAIGWLTVRMDNEHWSVALHLGSALAFMLSLVWLWLAQSRDIDTLPDWIDFESENASVWGPRLLWLSLFALVSLFSGAFVSTTSGANSGCGVDGLYDSWPLCQGELVPEIHDWVLQSQAIHRFLVAAVGVALLAVSRFAWKELGSNSNLSRWILASTALYMVNMLIGALYILSWDMSEGFEEWLSLFHLLLASLSFLILSTAYVGSITTKEESV